MSGISGSYPYALLTSASKARPHTSVSDSSLYKHIDPDLPESQRIRQLLIWLASRAMEPSSSSSRKGKSPAISTDPNLPPLPPGGAELLREVEEDILRQLAEKRIDTSAYSEPSESGSTWSLKENEQNVKNRAREKLFTEQIEEYVICYMPYPGCANRLFLIDGRTRRMLGLRLLSSTTLTSRMYLLRLVDIDPEHNPMEKPKESKERLLRSRRTSIHGRTNYQRPFVGLKVTILRSVCLVLLALMVLGRVIRGERDYSIMCV